MQELALQPTNRLFGYFTGPALICKSKKKKKKISARRTVFLVLKNNPVNFRFLTRCRWTTLCISMEPVCGENGEELTNLNTAVRLGLVERIEVRSLANRCTRTYIQCMRTSVVSRSSYQIRLQIPDTWYIWSIFTVSYTHLTLPTTPYV